MKNLLIFSLLFLMFFSGYSQIAIGSKYVNGSARLSYATTMDTITRKQNQFGGSISGTYGFFKKENVSNFVVFSYGLDHNISKYRTDSVNWNKSIFAGNSLSVGYGKERWFSLKHIHPNLYVTVRGALSAVGTVSSFKNVGQGQVNNYANSNGAGLFAWVSPSIALFLGKKWLLQTSLGTVNASYSVSWHKKYTDYVSNHSFNFSPNFSPANWTIGVSYFWGKKEAK